MIKYNLRYSNAKITDKTKYYDNIFKFREYGKILKQEIDNYIIDSILKYNLEKEEINKNDI